MKKICILSAVNIKHMTLISLYTEKLKNHGIEFDIIYMDKYGEDEDFPARRKYVYKNIINPQTPKAVKVLQYFKFRKYATRLLQKNAYDFIIVWNDVAIFMFADYLARHWRGKYCLNIRDYCHQKNRFVYKRFQNVIANAAFTTVSSDAFKSFLPAHEYIHVHSMNMEILRGIEPRTGFRPKGMPIRIAFIGNVRFFETNKALLETFKNDARFELGFYGTNANVLRDYAAVNGISNAAFHDKFPVADTKKFIEQTDIINNLYGSGRIALENALSIKLYYGIYNKTPILASKNTYTERIADEYGIGFAVDTVRESLPDELFGWYTALDFSAFSNNCDRLLQKIDKDNQRFNEVFQQTILQP